MTKQCCATCVYSYCSLQMLHGGFLTGFGARPLCANHPDTPGRLREVSPAGICRNYRPRPPAPAQPQDSIRRINMAGGQFVLVDAADFEWLNRYTWFCLAPGYAARHEKGKIIFMHREIMNAPKGMVVDHIDGSKQNNCRSNLRVCTRRENAQNRAKSIGCTSRFKGVRYRKNRGKWDAQVYFNGEPFWLGYFDDEVEAACAYDRKAVELFGAFARLNFPEEWPPERRQQVYADAQPLREALAAKAEKAKEKRRSEARRVRAGRRPVSTPKRAPQAPGHAAKEKGNGRKGKGKKAKGRSTTTRAKTPGRQERQRRITRAERTTKKSPRKARRALKA